MANKTLLLREDYEEDFPRSREMEMKKYFWLIGTLSISVAILLFVLCQIGVNYYQIDSVSDLTLNREKRSINSFECESNIDEIENFWTEISERKRRNIDIDPNDMITIENEIIRRKRLIIDMKDIEAKFENCKQIQNDQRCEQFFMDMVQINKLLNENTGLIEQIRQKYDKIEENGMQPVVHTRPVPIHEDLDNGNNLWNNDKSKFVDALHNKPKFMPQTTSDLREFREKNSDDKAITPLKNPSFDPTGQILQVCDQINRQSSQSESSPVVNNLPGPTSSGFVQTHTSQSSGSFGSNNVQPHAGPTSIGFGPNNVQTHGLIPSPNNFPIQPQAFNQPQLSYRSSPLCFYPQVQPQMPVVQSVFVPQPFVNAFPAANVPQAGRMMFVTGGGQFAATSPSGQGFIPLNANQPTRARESLDKSHSRCPFSTQEKQQQQQQQQQQQKQSFPIEPDSRYAQSPKNVPQDSDIIYATFAGQHGSLNLTNPFNHCLSGETSCIGSNQCIQNEKWCDNVVDCVDSSDETTCSCTSRISEDKICDGYLDCPFGADEIGCFNCDKFSYSCFNSREEYLRSQHMRVSMCYAITEKCDGFQNCLNGKDEEDCSMLVGNLGLQTSFMVPYTDGILHRNYRGRWYPVCENPNVWAKEACEAELGILESEPTISLPITVLPGPFISMTTHPLDLSHQIRIHDSCQFGSPNNERFMVRVKCPAIKCGTTAKWPTFIPPKLHIRGDIDRQKREEDFVRIVGGDRSAPHSWPFIVAMYKDGSFHCGGTIINENWILSAAHCMARAANHYYEIHAGLLRRYSYAPEVQISIVTKVITNSGYNLEMANDLALLRIKTPLQFNRWVRPICLPSPERVTLQPDEKWMFGPAAGSVCTAVGWGAIRERGPSPDNLKEVKVPIMEACKHLEDITGNEICAGEKDGGRDACQGDSGGPLFCQSVSNPYEQYIAGIVSHGEGCARRDEPGVYTRVALYTDWINKMENSDWKKTAISTKTICPGYVCAWNNRCISFLDRCNQFVDCLAGDDELECPSILEELFTSTLQAKSRKGRQDITPEPIEPIEPKGIKSDVANASNVDSFGKKLPAEIANNTNFSITTQQSPTPLESSTIESQTINTEHHTTMIVDTVTEMRRTTISSLDSTTPEAPALNTTTTTSTFKPPHTTHKSIPLNSAFATTDKSLSPTEDEENFGPPIKLTDRNTTLEKPLHEVIKRDDIFVCTKFNQTINIELRCDGVDDCIDSSDENNCTCRDLLLKNEADLICNGHVDCLDLSDEKNCLICSADEFGCRLTKKCISKASQCDTRTDCEKGEDELDCYALTDGQNIVLDTDLRPELNHKGIVSLNVNGLWAPVCVHRVQIKQNEKIASEACSTLGFIGSSYHNVTEVTKDRNKVKLHRNPSKDQNKFHQPINKHLVDDPFSLSLPRLKRQMGQSDSLGLNEIMVGTPPTCWGLYVECIPHSVRPIIETNPNELPNSSDDAQTEIQDKIEPTIQTNTVPNVVIPPKKIKNETIPYNVKVNERNFYAPWSASVFINGYLQCFGVLIDRFWVLTEASCVAEMNWERNVIYVLFGRTKNVKNIKRKDEQIIRVDCMKTFDGTNVTLLHLVNGVQYRRHTLPTFLPDSPNVEDDDCVAVSYDKSGDLISIPVLRNAENNTNSFSSLGSLELLKCSDLVSYSKYGTIVCRADNSSYYPVSLFERKNGLCAFKNATNFELLDESYPKISKIANWQFCNYAKEEPKCEGFQCPLGKCIALGLLCDGNQDCDDNSDEEPAKCIEILKRCRSEEFKCSNGDCIPKSKFCDIIADCNDQSDEPMNCTCLNYLKITDPSKICDGIPTCADKSDEIGCDCRSDSFHCNATQSYCIPKAFVCDGKPECPNGDDEAFCYALEQPTDTSNNYYRVAERSSGAWETKCIAKEQAANLNQTELKHICIQLGFNDIEKVFHRLIDPIGNVTHIERNYPRRAFKILTRIPSSTVKINDNFHITLMPSSRVTKPIEWNKHDENSCFQLEIICKK